MSNYDKKNMESEEYERNNFNSPFEEIPDEDSPTAYTKEKVNTSLDMIRGIFSSVEGVFGIFTSIFKSIFK